MTVLCLRWIIVYVLNYASMFCQSCKQIWNFQKAERRRSDLEWVWNLKIHLRRLKTSTLQKFHYAKLFTCWRDCLLIDCDCVSKLMTFWKSGVGNWLCYFLCDMWCWLEKILGCCSNLFGIVIIWSLKKVSHTPRMFDCVRLFLCCIGWVGKLLKRWSCFRFCIHNYELSPGNRTQRIQNATILKHDDLKNLKMKIENLNCDLT